MMSGKLPSSPSSREIIILHAIPILFLTSYVSLLISPACGGGHETHNHAPHPVSEPPHLRPTTPLPSPHSNVTHHHRCLDSERSALLQFKAGLNDPHGRLSSWWGFDCCRWRGVACHSTTGAVVKVDIHNPYSSYSPADMRAVWNLSGRIDSSLLNLKSLRHLDLSGNTFHGTTIPAFIGSFKKLRYLNLSHARFMGTIPPQLGNLTRLHYLDLSELETSSLRVDGFQWVAGLSSLRYLAMDGVNLSAVGSDWVQLLNQRLPSLVELHLFFCDLRSIPVSLHFVNLTSLEVIDLGHNSISSTIPSWLPNITSLVYINMGQNNLHGSIPVDFSKLPYLEYLDLCTITNLTADVAELLGHGGWPRINTLRIYGYNLYLYGEIPASIGNLTSLVQLYLSGNNIGGGIPASIGNLTSLVELSLSSNNNIGGGIPASLGKLCELTVLDLSYNNLTGDLLEFLEPHEKCISGGHRPSPLPRLMQLDLRDNSLIGNLPAWLFERASLEFLMVSNNKFTGVVTEAHLSKLRNLHSLWLDGTSLTLNISSDWIPPFQLEVFYVPSCQLGPKFPSWIKTQRELDQLDLSKNGISDEVPSWFWDLSSISVLDISFNRIGGQVPRTWSPSPYIYLLNMSSNLLRGRLPPLTSAGNLGQLDLSANGFCGPIWTNIGEMMPNMNFLSLAGNYLSGEIPATIGHMRDLRVLDLSMNNLTGGIPTALLDCSSLIFVNLGNNNLTGAIPSALGGLKYLSVLQLNNNLLSGEIPPSIRDCLALEILDVGGNILHGNIPTGMGNLQTLRVLRLRSNRFSGGIPLQLSNLRLLQVLDLAENKFKGLIPETLGSLKAMMGAAKLYSISDRQITYYKISLDIHTKGQYLEYVIKTEFLVTSIDLSGNTLSGEFPESLMNLSGLVFMDLSRNLLTGTIPDAIGHMRQLQSLDLSSNHFWGKIPPSMAYLTFLSFLNLSNNNFSGQIPAGGQLETFNNASFLGNPYLCGPLLPSHCPRDNQDGVSINDKSVETFANNDFYMSLGLGFAFGLLAPLIILYFKKSWGAVYFKVVDQIVDKFF